MVEKIKKVFIGIVSFVIATLIFALVIAFLVSIIAVLLAGIKFLLGI